MKTKRLLFLVMAICLASGVKAQFYDGPDDIYFYVEYKNGSFVDNGYVLIFNFDGEKGALLTDWYGESAEYYGYSVKSVKNSLLNNPTCFEEKVEKTEYNLKYIQSNTYQIKGNAYKGDYYYTNFRFSYDRNTLDYLKHRWYVNSIYDLGWTDDKKTYRRVDKSYFKVGRSKTPSSTLHE